MTEGLTHRILRTQVERDLERYAALPKRKSPERDAALLTLIESVAVLSKLERDLMKPGPTHDYPAGKLNADDEGGLKIAIADDGRGNIIINFGKEVAWIAMSKVQAIEFANLIIDKAEQP